MYYLEAIDGVFDGTRTVEWDPRVEECDDDNPAAAYFTGEESGIIVGATTSGQSALPPGFSATGIIGTIAATGLSSGLGGGVGVGTGIAVGAGAAAAAGAVVVVGGETTTTLSPDPEPGPPTASTSSTSTPATTSSVPGSTTTVVGSMTTVVGSTTTTIASGSTTTSASTSSSTSSSPTTTTVALPPLDAGCFTLNVLSECRIRVDATCVNLPVDRYDWILDLDDRWNRVTFSNGPASLTYDWGSDCDEDNETIRVQLTVHRGADSDAATKSINVPGSDLKASPDGPRRLRFETELMTDDASGRARGRVLVNGVLQRVIDDTHPVVVQTTSAGTEHTVRAVVVSGGARGGSWRFDFARAPGFVRGSLRIVRGSVSTSRPDAVVSA